MKLGIQFDLCCILSANIHSAAQVSPFESFISPVEDVITSANPHLRVQVTCDVWCFDV